MSVCFQDYPRFVYYLQVTDNSATELYFEEVFESGYSGEDPLGDLRYYLYPESSDPALISLSEANSVQVDLGSLQVYNVCYV